MSGDSVVSSARNGSTPLATRTVRWATVTGVDGRAAQYTITTPYCGLKGLKDAGSLSELGLEQR